MGGVVTGGESADVVVDVETLRFFGVSAQQLASGVDASYLVLSDVAMAVGSPSPSLTFVGELVSDVEALGLSVEGFAQLAYSAATSSGGNGQMLTLQDTSLAATWRTAEALATVEVEIARYLAGEVDIEAVMAAHRAYDQAVVHPDSLRPDNEVLAEIYLEFFGVVPASEEEVDVWRQLYREYHYGITRGHSPELHAQFMFAKWADVLVSEDEPILETLDRLVNGDMAEVRQILLDEGLTPDQVEIEIQNIRFAAGELRDTAFFGAGPTTVTTPEEMVDLYFATSAPRDRHESDTSVPEPDRYLLFNLAGAGLVGGEPGFDLAPDSSWIRHHVSGRGLGPEGFEVTPAVPMGDVTYVWDVGFVDPDDETGLALHRIANVGTATPPLSERARRQRHLVRELVQMAGFDLTDAEAELLAEAYFDGIEYENSETAKRLYAELEGIRIYGGNPIEEELLDYLDNLDGPIVGAGGWMIHPWYTDFGSLMRDSPQWDEFAHSLNDEDYLRYEALVDQLRLDPTINVHVTPDAAGAGEQTLAAIEESNYRAIATLVFNNPERLHSMRNDTGQITIEIDTPGNILARSSSGTAGAFARSREDLIVVPSFVRHETAIHEMAHLTQDKGFWGPLDFDDRNLPQTRYGNGDETYDRMVELLESDPAIAEAIGSDHWEHSPREVYAELADTFYQEERARAVYNSGPAGRELYRLMVYVEGVDPWKIIATERYGESRPRY